MLSSGRQATSSACLRCQLRQVLFRLGRRTTPSGHDRALHRSFSHTTFVRQEEAQLEQQFSLIHNDRGYKYRHVHVVGPPGRRQRTHSEKLEILSLGRPAEVIVFEDIIEPNTSRIPAWPHIELDQDDTEVALSAEDIQALVTKNGQAPKQAEVNASIDGLRPENSVLDWHEFDGLTKRLLSGYNVQQLAAYFVYALSPKSGGGKVRFKQQGEMVVIPWIPGKTGIEKRRSLTVSSKRIEQRVTKKVFAEQILRQAWNISVTGENQQVGELEIRLQPWQMAMLFDLTHDSKPVFEHLISSRLLFCASDIRPHRPDNIMRITARRQDAEEIAAQLQMKMRSVKRIDVRLNVFDSLRRKHEGPPSLETLFNPEDIRFVANRTASVLEMQPKGVLAIYNLDEGLAYTARRLLLGLLELPSPTIIDSELLAKQTDGKGKRNRLKTFAGYANALSSAPIASPSVHRRHHALQLYRQIAPLPKAVKTTELNESPWQKLEGRLAQRLASLPDIRSANKAPQGEQEGQPEWLVLDRGEPSEWAAQFCALVRPREDKDGLSVDVETARTLKLHQTPGLHQVLSYFKPIDSNSSPGWDENPGDVQPSLPTLNAHLTPSPFVPPGLEALKRLPRMKLQFRTRLDEKTGRREPRLHQVQAVLKEQETQVPFPDHATDLVFSRGVTMSMCHDLFSSASYAAFGQRLRESLAMPGAALDGTPELDVTLPHWLFKSRKQPAVESKSPGPSTKYLLDHFENVQDVDLIPLDHNTLPETVDVRMLDLITNWPAGMILRLSEVDAGVLGVSRTEVKLIKRRPEATAEDAKTTGTYGHAVLEYSHTLTKTAMAMLKVLTRASAGTLKPLVGKRSES